MNIEISSQLIIETLKEYMAHPEGETGPLVIAIVIGLYVLALINYTLPRFVLTKFSKRATFLPLIGYAVAIVLVIVLRIMTHRCIPYSKGVSPI